MTARSWDDPRMEAVRENLKRIRHEIAEAAARAGRDPGEITLLGATKTVPPELVNFAVSQGLTHIGENRAQELAGKLPFLELEHAELHFIGHLQTNKVRKLVPDVAMIQSVDSPRLAQAVSAAAADAGKVMDVLMEINIGGEASKSGVQPEQAAEFAEQLAETPGIRLRGLMTIPPDCPDRLRLRNYFSRIHKLFIDIRGKKSDNRNMNVLSMGMSGDYIDAVSEGSTMVRIGSALFGSRVI